MKYRKLRIAWSVTWGVVAVMLCVLWVRSYWWSDFLVYDSGQESDFRSTYLLSDSGGLSLKYSPFTGEADGGWTGWLEQKPNMYDISYINAHPYRWHDAGVALTIHFPYLHLVPGCICIAVIPWLSFKRFSLRTLLIATTLVAVGLGAIIWTTK